MVHEQNTTQNVEYAFKNEQLTHSAETNANWMSCTTCNSVMCYKAIQYTQKLNKRCSYTALLGTACEVWLLSKSASKRHLHIFNSWCTSGCKYVFASSWKAIRILRRHQLAALVLKGERNNNITTILAGRWGLDVNVFHSHCSRPWSAWQNIRPVMQNNTRMHCIIM